jgi:phosphoglycerate dehydrogenase-like enzyme
VRRAVLELASPRPIWQPKPHHIRQIRRAFGPGWQVINIASLAQSDGDGGGGSPRAVRAARGAEVYVGFGLDRAIAGAGLGSLRWAHSAAAGVGSALTPELRATGAAFTNSAGIHAEPMADWVIAALGFCFRGFHEMVVAQPRKKWSGTSFTDRTVPTREFVGARIGLVGLGGIGSAVARRCAALGMQVRAIRRNASRPLPRGVDWAGGPGKLKAVAAWSDALVVTAPHTRETRHMIDDSVLGALPRGAFVLNVSRGALIDEAALLRRLRTGHVAGCALDVFQSEPLPAKNPLWAHPRVLVSPHVSAVSERFWERETELIVDNIRRYRSGRRLRNLVDQDAGY